jgi:hypothetical protein
MELTREINAMAFGQNVTAMGFNGVFGSNHRALSFSSVSPSTAHDSRVGELAGLTPYPSAGIIRIRLLGRSPKRPSQPCHLFSKATLGSPSDPLIRDSTDLTRSCIELEGASPYAP